MRILFLQSCFKEVALDMTGISFDYDSGQYCRQPADVYLMPNQSLHV
jgi:hypothetical protein